MCEASGEGDQVSAGSKGEVEEVEDVRGCGVGGGLEEVDIWVGEVGERGVEEDCSLCGGFLEVLFGRGDGGGGRDGEEGGGGHGLLEGYGV